MKHLNMRKTGLLIALLLNIKICSAQNAGHIMLDSARFITGDNAEWSNPGFNDSGWKMIRNGTVWQEQGYDGYHGYAWYRIHVMIPSSLKNRSAWKDSLRIYLAHVNDVDETYLNGVKIGKIGAFPTDAGGYVSKWPATRTYCIPASSKLIKWDAENIIAVRVYDGGGTGGIFMGVPFVDMLEKTDGITLDKSDLNFIPGGNTTQKLMLKNTFKTTVSGYLVYTIRDAANKKVLKTANADIDLQAYSSYPMTVNFPNREGISFTIAFTEKASRKTISFDENIPFTLTPAPLKSPVINGPAVVGAKAGHDILFKIPISGKRPMAYSVANLPAGLAVDNKTGIISGRVANNGDYKLVVTAKNQFGSYHKTVMLRVGEKLALTPPMGWNSWNCWGLSVSADKVKSSADALLKKGLVDYGWSYINVDDGWQNATRDNDGNILGNSKFPDMRELSDYLHNNGLKFGIYSSPGTKTCGGFLGSLDHEAADAVMYNKWGVDYLKYDLCSYTDVIGDDTTLAAQQKPYFKMRDELAKQPRDIVYSLCQYGIKKVWEWGPQAHGNSWRTTEDITDTWESMAGIGFKQDTIYSYAGPGGWNDPDMLVVGMVGWGENLHPSHLTPDEQYTHISLWCMLSAPLLIGCDISKLDQFTLNLLENNEVLAVDQDALGKQARKIAEKDGFQLWEKEMSDGSRVIGIFNLNNSYADYQFDPGVAGLGAKTTVRDLWRQKDIGHSAKLSFHIPPHGVRLLKVIRS